LYPIKQSDKHGNAIWHCKCDCGKEFDTSSEMITKIISCGCLT
jgi:hypothetical protein